MGYGTSFEGNISIGYNLFGRLFLKAGIGIGLRRQIDYYDATSGKKLDKSEIEEICRFSYEKAVWMAIHYNNSVGIYY